MKKNKLMNDDNENIEDSSEQRKVIDSKNKERNQLLEQLENDVQRDNFLRLEENVQRMFINNILSEKTPNRKKELIQKLIILLNEKRFTVSEIKKIQPRQLTIKKEENMQSYSELEFWGEALNQVRGSIEALKDSDVNDPEHKLLIIKAGIEHRAREFFLMKIELWIRKLVREQFHYERLEEEDFIQVVKVKVWEKLATYDYKKAKLTTFITSTIRKEIFKEIRTTAFEFTVSDHDFEKLKKIRKFLKEFYALHQRYPYSEEIEEATKIKKDDIITLLPLIGQQYRKIKRNVSRENKSEEHDKK